MKIGSLVSNSILKALLVILASVPLYASEPVDYESNWLGKSDKITPEAFQKLIDLSKKDTESSKILASAVQKLKLKNEQELIQYFYLFNRDEIGGQTGRTTYEFRQQEFIGLTEDELALSDGTVQSFNAKIEQVIAQTNQDNIDLDVNQRVFDYTVIFFSKDFIQVRLLGRPQIYLSPNSALNEAYCNFIHELYHFTTFNLKYSPDYLFYKNAEEYAIDQIKSTPADMGLNEVDAYIISIKAALRLESPKIPRFLNGNEIMAFFNKKAEFNSSIEALASYLLSADGYDYLHSHFAPKYEAALKTNYSIEKYMYAKINGLLDSRITKLGAKSTVNKNATELVESIERLKQTLKDRKKKIDALEARLKELNLLED